MANQKKESIHERSEACGIVYAGNGADSSALHCFPTCFPTHELSEFEKEVLGAALSETRAVGMNVEFSVNSEFFELGEKF